jgi:hypothetical protein
MDVVLNSSKTVKDCTLSIENSKLKVSRSKGESPEFVLTSKGIGMLRYQLGELAHGDLSGLSISIRGNDFVVTAENRKTTSFKVSEIFSDPVAVKVAMYGLPPTTGELAGWYRHERQVRGVEPQVISRLAAVRKENSRVIEALVGSFDSWAGSALEESPNLSKVQGLLRSVWPKAGDYIIAHFGRCIGLAALRDLKHELKSAKTPEDLVISNLVPLRAGMSQSGALNLDGVEVAESQLIKLLTIIGTAYLTKFGNDQETEAKFVSTLTDVIESGLGLRAEVGGRQQEFKDLIYGKPLFMAKVGDVEKGYNRNQLFRGARTNPKLRWTKDQVDDYLANAGARIPVSDFYKALKGSLMDDIDYLRSACLESLKPKLSTVRDLGFMELYRDAYRGGEEILRKPETKQAIVAALVKHYETSEKALARVAERTKEYEDRVVQHESRPKTPAPIIDGAKRLLAEWQYYGKCLESLTG